MAATSWIPVPDAPTIPMLPGFETFVNAMGIDEMTPVPQSGPMSMRPFSWALRVRRTSSSSEMLSENENTLSPRSSAFSISGAVYSPGVEKRARLASGSAFRASSQLVTSFKSGSSFLTDKSERNSSVFVRTASRTLESSESTTTTMSLGLAASASGVSSPAFLKMSLFASVPIMI